MNKNKLIRIKSIESLNNHDKHKKILPEYLGIGKLKNNNKGNNLIGEYYYKDKLVYKVKWGSECKLESYWDELLLDSTKNTNLTDAFMLSMLSIKPEEDPRMTYLLKQLSNNFSIFCKYPTLINGNNTIYYPAGFLYNLKIPMICEHSFKKSYKSIQDIMNNNPNIINGISKTNLTIMSLEKHIGYSTKHKIENCKSIDIVTTLNKLEDTINLISNHKIKLNKEKKYAMVAQEISEILNPTQALYIGGKKYNYATYAHVNTNIYLKNKSQCEMSFLANSQKLINQYRNMIY